MQAPLRALLLAPAPMLRPAALAAADFGQALALLDGALAATPSTA